jgi:hypothetical protein
MRTDLADAIKSADPAFIKSADPAFSVIGTVQICKFYSLIQIYAWACVSIAHSFIVYGLIRADCNKMGL